MRYLAFLLLGGALHAADFLPMAVWYGGGKARAPMLERDARGKKEIWRKDIRQIKALGFNTVRTWIDWATGEPKQGQYHFENLDVMLELAHEEGLRVFLQVYMDSAPRWVGANDVANPAAPASMASATAACMAVISSGVAARS